jgi:hypothetical protein
MAKGIASAISDLWGEIKGMVETTNWAEWWATIKVGALTVNEVLKDTVYWLGRVLEGIRYIIDSNPANVLNDIRYLVTVNSGVYGKSSSVGYRANPSREQSRQERWTGSGAAVTVNVNNGAIGQISSGQAEAMAKAVAKAARRGKAR